MKHRYFARNNRWRPIRLVTPIVLALISFVQEYQGEQHTTTVAMAETTAFDLASTATDLSQQGTGQGIMFFAYGQETETTTHYLREAFVSARCIKALNPTVNITLVTNPGVTLDITGAFDMVINVKQEHLLPGDVPAWTPIGIKRQWLTRLVYFAHSPYEITLALDSQALCCASGVDEILKLGPGEFDIAFAVQGPRTLAPHNWALMYRLNDKTRRLFTRWRILHIAKNKAGSDQVTLHMAAGSLALQGELNVGIIAESVALAVVPYNRTAPAWPRSSPLVAPGPIHFVHYNAYTPEEEETTCEKLNRDTSRARVIFQASSMPRSETTNVRTANTWQMMYSRKELEAAAKRVDNNALYFKGLDWDNSAGNWGQQITPWRKHYHHCWNDLFKEVDEGIQRLLGNPRLRYSPVFIAEFGDDKLWPPP